MKFPKITKNGLLNFHHLFGWFWCTKDKNKGNCLTIIVWFVKNLLLTLTNLSIRCSSLLKTLQGLWKHVSLQIRGLVSSRVTELHFVIKSSILEDAKEKILNSFLYFIWGYLYIAVPDFEVTSYKLQLGKNTKHLLNEFSTLIAFFFFFAHFLSF